MAILIAITHGSLAARVNAAPARVMGIALNTWGLDDATARAEIAAAAAETGLPTTDAVRFGTGMILDAIMAA
jgi:uncharacterized NAD-dependent epimerase/dehydratase family protein